MADFGVIPIIKPVGITSFRVVHILRKITGIKKIGHTGTLDPFASGLLPICIGKATRIAEKISGKNKEYHVTLQLGSKTDSGDITGKVILSEQTQQIGNEQLSALKEKVLAIRSQKPPAFSAIKVSGKRAYELARKNEKFDLPPRAVKILEFEILKYDHPQIDYRVVVSKGTYIRSLSETIAEMLGTIGTTTTLHRSMIDGMEFAKPVELESITVENWRQHLLPVPAFFPDRPFVKIENPIFFQNGKKIAIRQEDAEEVMVFDESENFLGFGNISAGELQPVQVFI